MTVVQDNSTEVFDYSTRPMKDGLNSTLPSSTYPTPLPSTSPSTPKSTIIAASPTSTLFDNPHFDSSLRKWVYSFDDFLPYPSVYFPVTVVAGKYRPRLRLQRSLSEVSVFSRGENLPNGYTHIVEALPLENGHIIRVPDPASIDVLVEFSFLTPRQVIDHLFKGAGYFRRRKQDAFLFTCPTSV
ncbi:unnamed protein product [Strongylus vulgaris]|uniref:Uncharacterized protein n=1 Tax=Strongylus vulgaris TaxID=40348 RepID=A0A3P7I8D3_STRVU|nr:unnamed protein product [Strongylus vulgaris]